MSTTEITCNGRAVTLPAYLEIIPASVIRRQIPETNLWRLEQSGELPALRIKRRRFYRLSDWRAFLNRAAKAPPVAVPWVKQKGVAQ